MSFQNKPFTFGAATQSPNTSIFGGSSTPQQSTSIFGAKPATQTTLSFTSSGFGINKPASTVSPFGQQSQPQAQQQQQQSILSSSTGFGNKPAVTSAFTFGGGTTATQPSTTAANTSFTGFGQTKPTTTTGGFGGFGQTTTNANTSIFGATQTQPQQQQQTGSLFSFSQQPQQQQQSNQLSLTGGFGSGFLGGNTSFQQPQQQQQQQTSFLNQSNLNQTQMGATIAPKSEPDHFMNALIQPQVFNDERDNIIAKWNQLQAFYGNGKIFYQNSAIDVGKDNLLNRFKTIGYNIKPTVKNEDGLICLIINKKEDVVKTNQKSIVESLHKIFNSEQSLSVVIDSIKPSVDDKTEVVFYVNQRISPLNEQTNRVPCQTVYAHLNKQEVTQISLATKPTVKQQLEQLNVVNFYPLTGLSEEEIKTYLNAPPIGINPLLWEQAKKNNPNSKKLLPVTITGLQEINKRFKLQDQENQNQKRTLSQLNNTIDSLNTHNKLIATKIEQFRARNEDLEQRVLKLMINYEIRRKIGVPLQDNERYLLSILDSFQMELNSPINKEIQRQKLNNFKEIIKTIEKTKRQPAYLTPKYVSSTGAVDNVGANVTASKSSNVELMDSNSLNDIQKSLREQHKAFKSLIDIINQDQKDLNKIKKDLFNEK